MTPPSSLFISRYHKRQLPPFIVIRSDLSGDKGRDHLDIWISALLKQLNLSFEHPDVLCLKKEEKSKTWKASATSMKEFHSFQNHRPLHAPHRLIFFKEAHLMEERSCSKLLKTLEEPQKWISIIFATSGFKKFPPTVESRAITLFVYNEEQKKDSVKQKNLLSSFLKGEINEHSVVDRLTGNRVAQKDFLSHLILHKRNNPVDFKDADRFLSNLKWFVLGEVYENPLGDRLVSLLKGLRQ